MWKTVFVLLAPSVLADVPAVAQIPVRANYSTYAHGFDVLDLNAAFEVNPRSYSVRVHTHTVGAVSVVVSFDLDTTVTGTFSGGRPHPIRYYSTGKMRGSPRETLMEYRGDQPELRTLVPPNTDDDRDDVAPAAMANTVDTLSAMADLVGHVTTTGRCEGELLTFDSRRLARLTSSTGGEENLEQTGRSSFAGPALRCDFVGVQTGGFKHDEDIEVEKRPQRGSAWFARTVPGGPMIPVRIVFRNRYFGEATMYLTSSGPQ